MATRLHRGWWILVLAVLAVFCALGLGRFGYGMVLPAMQSALDLSNTETGLLQSWNLLGYLLVVAWAGALASRIGPRRVVAGALVVVGLALLLTGVADGFRGTCVGRFLTGVGGAAANVPVMGLLAAWFAPRRRGLAAGIAVAGSSVGLAFSGLVVPGVLAAAPENGWRLCWGLFGVLTLAIAVLCAVFLRNRAIDVGLRPIGESPTPAGSAPPPDGTAAEDVPLVFSSYLWRLGAVYFAYGFSYILYTTYFVKYLRTGLGQSAEQSGALWFQIGLASSLSALLWGVVSDRWDRRRVIALVFALQGFSYLAVGMETGRLGATVSAGLFAATAWSIPALMAAVCGDLYGARRAPAALGLVTLAFGVGQVIAPVAGGWLADRTASFHASFLLAAATAWLLGCAGTVMLLPSIHHEPGQRRG